MPPRKRAAPKAKAKATASEETKAEEAKVEEPKLEPTPIADQVEADLKNIPEEDVTHFEEDDDPLTCVGELVDEGPVND